MLYRRTTDTAFLFVVIIIETIIVKLFKIKEFRKRHIKSYRNFMQGFDRGFFVSPLTMLSNVDCLTSLMVASLLIDIPLLLQSDLILFIYSSPYSISSPHYILPFYGLI